MPIILACTDGSLFASSVYQHAAWAATRLTTGVEVLHVINHHRQQSPTHDLSGAIGVDATAELTEELTKLEEAQGRVARLKGKGILEAARQQLAAAGMTNVTLTQRHGTVVETLAELEPRAELVVVGKSGDHAQRRLRGCGQFWTRPGLTHLLQLCVLVKNKDDHLLWN